jgi:Domain of unknown function (DUF6484)
MNKPTPPPAFETSIPSLPAATRGILTGFTEGGDPLIDFPNNPAGAPIAAVATIDLAVADAGRDIIIVFEDADPTRPVILGVVAASGPRPAARSVEVTADGKRVTVAADREIVLKCGEASITLTAAGKILIRGAHVLSRSSGTNRIKGGSVQIN